MRYSVFMIRRFCIFLGAALVLSAPALKAQTSEDTAPQPYKDAQKVFNAESTQLDNGLQIVVIPNHRAPVVTHMVWYKVGAADEPPGKSGIAHFLEHLMFKGSEGLTPGEFSEKVRRLGGNDNAFTSQDYTAYFQSVPAEHLETVMEMEAGRMRGLNPPVAEVESENKVILEERRQRIDNNPGAQFYERLASALFVNHPYGIPVLGWYDEMESLSWGDAKSFYDVWYAPNNAILIVSGDVKADEVYRLAKKYYGPLEPADIPERRRPQVPSLAGESRVVYHSAQLREPMIQIFFRAPSEHQSPQTAIALQVLEEIMGGGPTSRLYQSLVVEKKIATGAGLSYQGSAWDDGTISLYATPAENIGPEQVETALKEELALMLKDGLRPGELDDAKKRMQAEAIYALDSLSGPAMIFGRALTTGSSIDSVEYWPQRVSAVSEVDVLEAARLYLDMDEATLNKPVTGYLLPANSEAPTEETP